MHYYENHKLSYDVHPNVKIFCNGALTAELGPSGYYTPEVPITFAPFDGDGSTHRFWVVADVAFKHDACINTCIVKPIYSDPAGRTPFFMTDEAAKNVFVPAYPAAP